MGWGRHHHAVPSSPVTRFPRQMTAERMDAPDVPPTAHLQALAGLRRINRISRTAETMLGRLTAFGHRQRLKRLRLLDVASGGGDVPIAIALGARRAGLTVDLTLFDRSPVALDHAATQARMHRIDVQTIVGDAATRLPKDAFDAVTCSLFLHHLSATDVVATMANMLAVAAGVVLISDLRRARLGLVAAHIGCRLLSRSDIVHFDGPASVKAAWTVDELSEMAETAGLRGATITPLWPWRMLLEWERHA